MDRRDAFERTEVAPTATGRPWLGIKFTCGGAYVRVYRSIDGTQYHARCPTCGRAVTFRVGSGGTAERFFEVHCGR